MDMYPVYTKNYLDCNLDDIYQDQDPEDVPFIQDIHC